MSTDESDDPGANTAMFRAYVDQPGERDSAPATNRTFAVAVVVALLALVVLGVLVALAA